MFLICLDSIEIGVSFPRVRGDVPFRYQVVIVVIVFSPRARGCSFGYLIDTRSHDVFPACAGMFLWRIKGLRSRYGFPRVRGDVPAAPMIRRCLCLFSPRARGCSSGLAAPGAWPRVFPACAGMFPLGPGEILGHLRFSPRARGCS